jgi:hypothetical protein
MRGQESTSEQQLERTLLQAWQYVLRGQHPNGEIVSFRRDHEANYQYLRSPFVSTFVHDALGGFDHTSPLVQPGCLELVSKRYRTRFQGEVIEVRRRIRGFLAWQQEADGWWRFFGRGSGIDPDVNTTVCAAAALLEQQGARWAERRQQSWAAVRQFRAAEGRYFTFLKPRQGGYGWLNPGGWPVVGFDRVVNADVLRYLCLVDEGEGQIRPLLHFVLSEVESGAWRKGTPVYPNYLSFPFAVARAWRQGGLPEKEEVARQLVPELLAQQQERGDFGGPLSTAFAAAALINLGYRGPALERACRSLVWDLGRSFDVLYEDFVIDGFGSPALTAAMAMACLAQYQCLVEGASA